MTGTTKELVERLREMAVNRPFLSVEDDRLLAKAADALEAAEARAEKAKKELKEAKEACWHNLNNLQHVYNHLLAEGLVAEPERNEEKDGELASGLNITDAIQSLKARAERAEKDAAELRALLDRPAVKEFMQPVSDTLATDTHGGGDD